MRSTEVRRRHQRQRGVSLIEALIAAALFGITGVVGITAWDTAVVGARATTHRAWAQCMARGVMEAVLAAPWADGGYQTSLSRVNVTTQGLASGLQQVTVVVAPGSGGSGYTLIALKAQALAGSRTPDYASIPTGCPPP